MPVVSHYALGLNSTGGKRNVNQRLTVCAQDLSAMIDQTVILGHNCGKSIGTVHQQQCRSPQ